MGETTELGRKQMFQTESSAGGLSNTKKYSLTSFGLYPAKYGLRFTIKALDGSKQSIVFEKRLFTIEN